MGVLVELDALLDEDKVLSVPPEESVPVVLHDDPDGVAVGVGVLDRQHPDGYFNPLVPRVARIVMSRLLERRLDEMGFKHEKVLFEWFFC